jgi:CHAT domain-containing protein
MRRQIGKSRVVLKASRKDLMNKNTIKFETSQKEKLLEDIFSRYLTDILSSHQEFIKNDKEIMKIPTSDQLDQLELQLEKLDHINNYNLQLCRDDLKNESQSNNNEELAFSKNFNSQRNGNFSEALRFLENYSS